MQKTTVLIIVAIAATLVLIIAAIAAMLTARAESMQASNSIVLVRDGQPMATIMLAEKPTRSAQFAAAELQYHVEKITGAVLPILTNAAGATGVCVFVGESDATRVMGLKNESFSNQEYLISFRKEGLVLMGRDKEDRGQLNYTKASTFPDGFDEQGTCYAVYDFLEKFCGVQWYLPTDLGLVYTPAKTLAVGGPDVRRQPFMWHRLMSSEMRIPADLCGDTVRRETAAARSA